MKIDFVNYEFFDENNNTLKKIAKTGIIVATSFAIAGSMLTGCVQKSDVPEETPITADVSSSSINDFNIIINDGDCSDALFEEVCSKLSSDGLNFTVVREAATIGDNSLVITLDQQYSSGDDTLIFAPYDNSRVGYSDALSLAMQAALKQNGFFGNHILCGKIGYRVDENGNVIQSIPTETEESIEADSDSSFVTISFGTGNINAEWVAKSIEDGLVRYAYYLDNYDTGTDLIYRANSNDSVEAVANYFNTDTTTLTKFNNIVGDTVRDSQAIINPEVANVDAFDSTAAFSMNESRTRAY